MTSARQTAAPLTATGIAALGVVFGDIGTSPLYTLKAIIALAGSMPIRDTVLGSVSLIVWTLTIITTIKYIALAMRIDNDGEGGILALMSLLSVKGQSRPALVAAGLFGAALIYGDGAITPAISVLSALEGLQVAAPSLQSYVLPLAVTILAALFVIQPMGTARIGSFFGPIMLVWFCTIALLGLASIIRYPSILAAINPYYAIHFLWTGGSAGFLVLGGVFLCVTGAEALYADMGHFGPRPIRMAWIAVVFPALFLSYAGQGAWLLTHGRTADNIFYKLCPDALLLPLVVLATVATIIASQSIITGAFSMTRQAIQLGWMPRLKITQTSGEGYGQIYVGAVNWILMIITIALALFFQKSDNLASAYGIAVAATMLITTFLLFLAMREVWGWSLLRAGIVAGILMIVDATFFGANAVKIADGGYVPIVLAGLIYGLMQIWHQGVEAIKKSVGEHVAPLESFLAGLAQRDVARVHGTAVFLTRSRSGTPPVVEWYVEHAHALQRQVIAVTIAIEPRPWVAALERAQASEVAPGFWRVNATYGFLERPNIVSLLDNLKDSGCHIALNDSTYFVGLELVVPKTRGGLPGWMVASFAVLHRNAAHVADEFNFPRERLIEVGRQVAI